MIKVMITVENDVACAARDLREFDLTVTCDFCDRGSNLSAESFRVSPKH